MRTWTRASVDLLCGFCGDQIDVGKPMLVITAGTFQKRRCTKCAGEPVPDLPANVERVMPDSPGPIAMKSMLPLDWKRASSGEREVGEEG